jgi:hypothetical protein
MKILYNAVAVAALSKMQSSRITDLRSSTYYITGNWNSSYVLNGSVLLDSEKAPYTQIQDSLFNTAGAGIAKYSKNLTSSYGSILDYYKKICYDTIPDSYSILAQDIDLSNLQIFIEVTNPDVNIANNELVNNDHLTGDLSDIPTSYKLYKVPSTQYTAHAYAYTDSTSLPFVIPGGFGPHIIKEKVINRSSDVSSSNFSNKLTPATYKNYDFNFSTFSSYVQSSESPTSFNVQWTARMTATGTATHSATRTVKGYTNLITQYYNLSDGYSDVDANDKARKKIKAIVDPQKRIESIRNNFFYSGDIEISKYHLQYGTDPEDRKTGEYVKYIQYTIANSGIDRIKGIKIDGQYGTQTKSFLSIFQTQKGEIYTDGGVDSETKSYLIKVWKDLYKNNRQKFDAVVKSIRKEDPEVIKYISEHHNPDLDELNTSEGDYRRISFSGSKKDGPKGTIKDVFFVRVPAEFNTAKPSDRNNLVIKSIRITPGTFPSASKYKGIKINKIVAYKDDGSNNAPNLDTGTIISGAKSYSQSVIEIPITVVNGKNYLDYTWFAIEVLGGSLGGIYGPDAEGISLNNVDFSISHGNSTPDDTKSYAINNESFSMIFAISGTQNAVSTNTSRTINLSGRNSTAYSVSPVSITYTQYDGTTRTESLIGSTVNFSSTRKLAPHTNEVDSSTTINDQITLDYTTLNNYNLVSNSFTISSISSNGNIILGNLVGSSVAGNSITLSTNALSYTNSNIVKTTPNQINNYWLLKQDNSKIKTAKKSITVLDGLLLLCQPSDDPAYSGKPIGITVPTFTPSQLDQQETNIDYGAFVLENSTAQNNGIVYGFYDNQRKEFLGSILHYIDYQNRGPNNIYIGIIAVDADGNVGSSIDFFGPRNYNTVTPVRIPIKAAYPIYSAKYENTTKIKVTSIPSDIPKYEQWPLHVSSGAFTRDLIIDPSFGWVNWLQKYKRRTLRANYSTLNLSNIAWSEFLGRPYIDIKDESPIIISNKRIKLINAPIAVINEPSYSKVGLFNTLVNVYKRDSISGPWTRISSDLIRNVDAENGFVDFTSSIIPSDNNLIKVSYTSKSNGIPLKQVDGNPIPINPFLNRGMIEPDKALYIYIKPVSIYYKDSSVQSYSWKHVSEYDYGSAINFTYNNSIFNPYDSVNFDPFALPIALIHTVNPFTSENTTLQDLRIRGGGIKSEKFNSSNTYSNIGIYQIIKDVKEAISFWDVYPPMRHSYPKGGFIIIRLPREVTSNFQVEEEIYSIIERNLTAGVAYQLQDMDGNDWGVI